MMCQHSEKQRSEKNRANALSKKIQSACGAISIARILYEMEVEAEASFEADNEGDSEGNASNFTAPRQTQADAEPIYVKLWRKTKQYACGLGKGHPVFAKDERKGKAELGAEID
ncbi:DNA polymerase delta subunit 2 [Bienertia sinuspersici]